MKARRGVWALALGVGLLLGPSALGGPARAEVEEDPGLEGPLPRAAGWTSAFHLGGQVVRPEAGEPGIYQGEHRLRPGTTARLEVDLPGQVVARGKAKLHFQIDAGFEPCGACKAEHELEAPIVAGRGGRPHASFVLRGFDACAPHHGSVWRADQPRHTLPLLWAVTCP